MPSLKTSVSNGKASIASAITDKGISTSSTASFSTMASNIRGIKTAPSSIVPVKILRPDLIDSCIAIKGTHIDPNDCIMVGINVINSFDATYGDLDLVELLEPVNINKYWMTYPRYKDITIDYAYSMRGNDVFSYNFKQNKIFGFSIGGGNRQNYANVKKGFHGILFMSIEK